MAAGWTNTNADGTVTTKPQLLALLRAHLFSFSSVEDDDVLIRVYEAAAVVTGRSTRVRIGSGGAAITRRVRFTRVYVHQGGR